MVTQAVMSRFQDAPSAVCPEPTMCEQLPGGGGGGGVHGWGEQVGGVLPSAVSSAFSPELLAVAEICDETKVAFGYCCPFSTSSTYR